MWPLRGSLVVLKRLLNGSWQVLQRPHYGLKPVLKWFISGSLKVDKRFLSGFSAVSA